MPLTGYRCRVCGEFHEHEEVPLHYGAAAPFAYYAIPEAERAGRTLLSSDQCVIDDEHFFIVGNIDIPIIGHTELFSWDVWVSLSKANFTRAHQLWKKPGRESEPPYFGWLSTLLPGYPDTLSLKTNVHTREVGQRPFVELAAEQLDRLSCCEGAVGFTDRQAVHRATIAEEQLATVA